MKTYLTLWYTLPLTIILAACANSNGSTGSNGENNTITRYIAGNSAYGAPGRWSNNCLGESCVRADDDGNYQLTTAVTDSALMWTDIPHADGSTSRLYSRYRLDDSITTTLVNINPSTHAIMDIWSNLNHSMSIDSCAVDAICSAAIATSFSENVEQTLIDSLDRFLGDAWPAQRNPFADVYVASHEDALDAMHDYLQFVVTSSDFIVFDNQGEELIRTSLGSLVEGRSFDSQNLTTEVYEAAQTHQPESFSPNLITLSVSISPSQPTTPPFTLTVNASRSSSPNGDLTFSHDLSLNSGSTTTFSGDIVTTDIVEAGEHIWVVTATDTNGESRSQGFVISALINEDGAPSFGGQGSCVTPLESLDANSFNVCQEPQNGSDNQCDVISSSSVTLTDSPAPCAHEQQNDGALFGVCTLLTNEVRIFYYENPLRANNVETFAEKRARFETYCQDNFEGDWSITP